jgi:hypothetical protein
VNHDSAKATYTLKNITETTTLTLEKVTPPNSYNSYSSFTIKADGDTAITGLTPSTTYTVTLTSGNVSVTKTFTTLPTPVAESDPGTTIAGEVEDETDLQHITLRLDRGSVTFMSQMLTRNGSENYAYSFTNLPNGYYNVVVLSGGQIVTQGVKVSDGTVGDTDVTVPTIYVKSCGAMGGNESIVIDVKSGVPEIAKTASATGLTDLFTTTMERSSEGVTAADNATVTAGGTVEITLVVDKLPDQASKQAAERQIKNETKTNKVVETMFDLSVLKTVYQPDDTVSESTDLVTLPNLIAVTIKLPRHLSNRTASLVLYRIHESMTDVITKTANADGEYFELSADGQYITLHIKKFSVYALAANR